MFLDITKIGSQSMAAIICMTLFGIAIPVALAIVWQRKKKLPLVNIFIGASMFALFSIILSIVPKYFLFNEETKIGKTILSNAWIYALITGLLAGIFEEVARIVGFKFGMKNETSKKYAISYGIGHGGFEMMILFTFTGYQYYTYASIINAGKFGEILDNIKKTNPESVAELSKLPEQVASITMLTFILSLLERILIMALQICFSVIIFKVVKASGKKWLIGVAMLGHCVVSMIATLGKVGKINVYLSLGILAIITAFVLKFTYEKVYKQLEE